MKGPPHRRISDTVTERGDGTIQPLRHELASVPADGPVSWTAREDAAEAAALILESGGPYDGPLTIMAGAAPTFSEVAAIASRCSASCSVGNPVPCVMLWPILRH
ncbi:hypothetical protein QMK17_21350 [Rhodococcus sp. G-MC3]|uniref:hypothetical protein n=1 Tax=Rhodococcus sp. G-MC3 TaxID=3046209 RepID=UPI0024BAB7C9|nr:hypothetical protein [Rhodococcus sp. G-MC3]MDJ0395868.1 hypothetical protein [Rhodococcus sp. G-MC3]